MAENENNKAIKPSNMGLAIAMGAGVGIIFGDVIFDSVGVGIAVGAGIAIALSRFKRAT
ncbi:MULTISPECIES: hypothetical protein [Pseudoalteromonas]|uniref:Uncharacterized protein n=2 Tax=Pseudoalteromonas TaxID=53246 RepID=V4JI92_PSEL2|nr:MULTISPECIES: hypothetical protein [Pseudoalteromonas]ESP94632.1 hypothetical protein PL2TA16_00632 [Pseudoalteromonas luteoviolacea 2ta16]KZN32331.1 hypothetical protein N483_04040 [Pseudoalteromonas luteoviolacea NCIMB 1944]MBQ4834896.1 hypothetical protein [Pseudoalteromonas luteoviolacea]MCG7547533.1 hypothetical protein [Pseudoalteromonas sp. Of7M-16]MDK2596803.1 hypothetical protein [Pseudoalteromonas sp. P94(2023)]